MSKRTSAAASNGAAALSKQGNEVASGTMPLRLLWPYHHVPAPSLI